METHSGSLFDNDPGNIKSRTHLFPSSLAKQFHWTLEKNKTWTPLVDFIVTWNLYQLEFYLLNDLNAISMIFLHEIIHGLGFLSLWRNYFKEAPNILTPPTNQFGKLNYDSVFDGFIQFQLPGESTLLPLSIWYDQLLEENRVKSSGDSKDLCSTLKSSCSSEVGSHVMKLLTTKKEIAFFVPVSMREINPTPLALHTDTNYQGGSHIVHFHQERFKDSLMGPSFNYNSESHQNRSLASYLTKDVVMVLESLGWIMTESPPFQNQEYGILKLTDEFPHDLGNIWIDDFLNTPAVSFWQEPWFWISLPLVSILCVIGVCGIIYSIQKRNSPHELTQPKT